MNAADRAEGLVRIAEVRDVLAKAVPPHPATYPDAALTLIRKAWSVEAANLGRRPVVVDPMAGVGTIRRVIMDAICVELEREWCEQIPAYPTDVFVGDAGMIEPVSALDMVVVSPPWANRLADAKYAGSPADIASGGGARTKRRTYRIHLGRDLTAGSVAAMQWRGDGSEFCAAVVRALKPWVEALRPGGLLLVDIADHMRNGVWEPVCSTLASTIVGVLPVELSAVTPVDAPRFTAGAAKGRVRMPELLIGFRRTA